MTDITSRSAMLGALMAAACAASPAAAYDMDCKVILCMAGGFPTGCADAKQYMIDRITARPPKPPFGYCAMSDGSEYTAHDTVWARPRESEANGHFCADGRLFFDYQRDDGDERITAFCYMHTSTRRVSEGEGDWSEETVYHGRSRAQRIDFEVQITVEPGTDVEFRSPTYALNSRTGFVGER